MDNSSDYLWNRRSDLRVRVLSNLLYQQQRQKIMDRRDQSIRAATLVAGTAIFAQWSAASEYVKWVGGLVAVLSLTSFVFSFSAKSRDAAKRCAEWNALNKEIEAVGERDYTEQMLNEWFARAGDIEHGETAPNDALLLRAYVKACELLRCEPSKQPSFWERLPLLRRIP